MVEYNRIKARLDKLGTGIDEVFESIEEIKQILKR